jgi:hypothetical protein
VAEEEEVVKMIVDASFDSLSLLVAILRVDLKTKPKVFLFFIICLL